MNRLKALLDENSPPPIAPNTDEWADLKSRFRPPQDPQIDVLVPVYGGHSETLRCIFSVLDSPVATPFNLLVINDCSPDEQICADLKSLAADGLLELHEMATNLGFVGACNFGMALHPDRDVLLLNSDTEVHSDWLDRLRTAAYRHPRTGTVTPFSNNATICSYPRFCEENWKKLEIDDHTLDQLARTVNAGAEVEIPTGVGFCMYLRRDCLDDIGLLDLENFGKGYGEENDLSRRAVDVGWRNILAADVFVRHYGGTSFGASKRERMTAAQVVLHRLHPDYQSVVAAFIEEDPVQPYRYALDLARLARQGGRHGSMLFICHNWGGGTEVHVQDMRKILESQGMATILCKPEGSSGRTLRLEHNLCIETCNIPTFDILRDLLEFSDAIRNAHVRHVHVHHVAGLVPEATDFFRMACAIAGLPYDVTVHDYMPACPRINLIDRSGLYCGEPNLIDCEACIERDGSPFGKPAVWEWRDRFNRMFQSARQVYVPDVDVQARMQRYFPSIVFHVRPHPEPIQVHDELEHPRPQRATERKRDASRTRVALLGALGMHKGSDLLEALALHVQLNALPLDFVVVGYSDRDTRLKRLGVEVTGRYNQHEAANRLMNADADFVWFSSVCPETYSYTLSTAIQVGAYPVAFDLGAIASRLRSADIGTILPISAMLDVGVLAEMLMGIKKGTTPNGRSNQDRNPMQKPGRRPDESGIMLQDYYSISI